MDLVLNVLDSMMSTTEDDTEVEMPDVVPMDVTQHRVGTLYTVPDARTFVIHDVCTPKLMLALINEWRTELPNRMMEEAMRAFQSGFRFRVACTPDVEVVACEIIFETKRWVWLSEDCVFELAQELFN